MSEVATKIAKPQMRRLLQSQIKLNLIGAGISVMVAGLYMKFVYGDGVKKAYADFYKNYDIDKEFNIMRKKGLFDSCDAEDD